MANAEMATINIQSTYAYAVETRGLATVNAEVEAALVDRPEQIDASNWQKSALCSQIGQFIFDDRHKPEARRKAEMAADRVCDSCEVQRFCAAEGMQGRVRSVAFSSAPEVSMLKALQAETVPETRHARIGQLIAILGGDQHPARKDIAFDIQQDALRQNSFIEAFIGWYQGEVVRTLTAPRLAEYRDYFSGIKLTVSDDAARHWAKELDGVQQVVENAVNNGHDPLRLCWQYSLPPDTRLMRHDSA